MSSLVERGQPVKPKQAQLSVVIDDKSYTGFDVTRKLVQIALAQRAHLKRPFKVSESDWLKQVNRVISYISDETTLEEIGKKSGVTRETIRQSIAKGIKNLRDNCSLSTQLLFPPIKELELGKPRSQATRIRISRLRGGTSATIAAHLQSGKCVEELTALGLSSRQIIGARPTLSGWGIHVPYLAPGIAMVRSRELVEALQSATTDDKVEQLFGDVSLNFYHKHSRGLNPLLVSFSRLIRHDFFARAQDIPTFVDALQKAQPRVPLGMLEKVIKTGPQQGLSRYFFNLSRHRERVLSSLHADATLESFLTNPVKKLCGIKQDRLPTTTQLFRSGAFRPLSHLLTELGIRYGGKSSFRIADFFIGDCDTAIFNWGSSYFYDIAQEAALVVFIEKKLSKLSRSPLTYSQSVVS